MASKLDDQWQAIQQKVFTKWCNMHLGKKGKKIENIQTDFGDGIRLIELLEVIAAEPLGKFNKTPKMKIHKIQNVNLALEFIAKKGVKLWGISSEDIVDENLKLILGMVWTVILRFAIADISEEELNAKEALLLWCKKKTAGYDNVKVDNFHNSWKDGLALCALIHAHRPDLIDFNSLDKSDAAGNLQNAFDIAEKELGITKLLDVEDIVDVPKPDERSVMTYIAEFYRVFSADRKYEIAGRRIGKLVDLTMTNDELKNDYEAKAAEHTKWVKAKTVELSEHDFDNTLEGIKKLVAELNTFKSEEKPPKVADKLALATLNNTIQIKLSSAGHPAYVPPEGLATNDINNYWDDLEKAQQAREEALLAELKRQQLLDLLAKRFDNKATQLEDWIKQQQDELNKEENIENVEAAEQKLKALEAFKLEYEQNKARLADLHAIKDEYCNLDGKDKVPITERADKISLDFDALNDLVNKKAASLGDSLAKQQAMEELRKKFANAAKEYNHWVKDTSGDVSSTVFPDSLEGVEKYKSTLDEEDASIVSNNDAKKANLDDLWEQEKAMGITSNPYTVFTNDDVAAWHTQVNESLAERQKAYDVELERQKLNEEKRKEFAAEAQGFVDSCETRTKEIDALTGEPIELIESVKSSYDEGKPEAEKLNNLSAMQEDMAKMGIMENKHTPYTVPILQVNSDTLNRYVRNKISALEQEDASKKEYNEKASALVAWIDETQPSICKDFDNTLEGVRTLKNEWIAYKTTDRAQRGIAKINLETLFKKIQSAQDSRGRPPFVPADNLKLETVSAKWTEMSAEEKKWEESINEELSRQEKLFMQVKHFNSEADELEAKAEGHETYLNKVEEIASLDDSRIQLMTMDVFDENYLGSVKRLDALKARGEKIKGLKYCNNSELDERISALETRLNDIKSKAGEKREVLVKENDVQEKNESLRVDFAEKATAFQRFVRESKDSLDELNFGTTLLAVQESAAKLEESDRSYTDKSNEKKASCAAAYEALSSNGLDASAHTDKSMEDIEQMAKELEEALAARQSAYQAELARQTEYDADRKEWAEKAQSFVDYLDAQKSAVKAADGSPDEKTAAVKEIFQEGKEASAKLEELNASNTSMRGKGIYSNDYTPHTMNALQKRLQQHTVAVNNTLSYHDEEREFLQRELDNEKEWAEKQESEQRRLDFEFKCKNLIMYLDSIQDVLTDPINVSSVQGVEDLQKEFDATVSELESKKEEFDGLHTECAALKEIPLEVSVDVTSAKWEQANANKESRKQQLADTLVKQQENDALCKEFADKASAADTWIQQTTATLASTSGDMEEQLTAVRACNVEEGDSFVADLSQVAEKLTEANVHVNPYTEQNVPSIKARIEELVSSKKTKEDVLEKEILSKKHSTASPEQIEEFKEVFAHFDKNKTSSLNTSEFKSCLQSLGSDPSDSELDQLMKELGNGEDPAQIGFDNFLSHMIKISSDTTTEAEISAAFKDLAQDKDFVTVEDLRRSGMPTEKVDYLIKEMPAFEGVEGGYDYKAWAGSAFSR